VPVAIVSAPRQWFGDDGHADGRAARAKAGPRTWARAAPASPTPL